MKECKPKPRPEPSLDQLFAARDQHACQPIPPRTDEQEYFVEAVDDARVTCEPVGSQVRIRTVGESRIVGPYGKERGCIKLDELSEIAGRVALPAAFRPPWLDSVMAPRIRPHLLDFHLPRYMKPLVFESAATEWPWCTIGKLFARTDGVMKVGSGVLVGPRLLLTASHAMPWAGRYWDIRFVPNYRNGNDPRFGHAYVDEFWGIETRDDVTGTDYVICKLNWRIGDRTGWMGSQWWSNEDEYYNRDWISVGYPVSQPNGGERPSIEVPVKVVDIDNDGDGLEIETHKFALGGWSGGPLWFWINGDPRVVGIESGFEKDFLDPERTVFAGGRHLVDLVKYGWANWN